MLQHGLFPGSRNNSTYVVSQWEGNFTSPAESLRAPVQLSVVLLLVGGTKLESFSSQGKDVLILRIFTMAEETFSEIEFNINVVKVKKKETEKGL